MSTSGGVHVRCAACRAQSEQTVLRSVSAFDEPDLDFRPSEMMRSTMTMWLMRCPHCGYVADDIRKRPRLRHRELLALYERVDDTLPILAHMFHQRALHCERIGDKSGAIRAYLFAAWSCDDADDAAGAKKMRTACIVLVQRLMKHCSRKKWRLCAQLLADLMRRIGDVQALRAMNTADRRLDFATRELLVFQKTLAEKHDFTAHRRDEIDLEPYDDFFDKKTSTAPDPSLSVAECLRQAVLADDDARAKALDALDELRPPKMNRPYHEYDGVLLLHRGLPLDEEHPYRTKELAQAANEEFLDMLESYVVSSNTLREEVTLQNKVCMTMLYQLYSSPYLALELRDYGNAQSRLYVMCMDDAFTDDSSRIGFIGPKD